MVSPVAFSAIYTRCARCTCLSWVTSSSDFTFGTWGTDRSTRTRFAWMSYRTDGSNGTINTICSIFTRNARFAA